MTKYNNKVTYIDGHRFDSLKEANRYKELMLLQRQGVICGLEMQVPFVLVPTQRVDGKVVEHAVKYVADFTYHRCCDGVLVVEDVKGKRTPAYIIKRKLMLYVHHIKIKEI